MSNLDQMKRKVESTNLDQKTMLARKMSEISVDFPSVDDIDHMKYMM